MALRASLTLSLLRRAVRIRSGDPAVLEELSRCFVPAAPDAPTGPYDLDLLVRPSGSGLALAEDSRAALQRAWPAPIDSPASLCGALNQWVVAGADDHYVFHAGAVARGRAILLPGSSHAGKSTLTGALCRNGFDYLTDEVAAFEFPSTRVLPYPRALCLRKEVLAVLDLAGSAGTVGGPTGEVFVRPGDLGADAGSSAVELGLVAFPEYRAGASTELVALDTSTAVLQLLQASCSQQRFATRGLDWVIALARRLPCVQVVYADAAEAAGRLRAAFDGS